MPAVGIKFDDQSVDLSGVSDQRGRGIGGPVAIGGGGLGVVGLIIYLLISVLGGGSGVDTQLVPQDGTVQGQGTGEGDLETRCNTAGAIDTYDDCFLVKVYNEINEVWTDEFARAGEKYEQPGLTFFTQAVNTGCGQASSQVGPFYCPPDQMIYIDIGFLQQLQQQFGAEGRYAQAYILAHEAGHHLQTLFGTERKVRAAQQSQPSKQNELSVAMELQADCYAGVWSKLADDAGQRLDRRRRGAAGPGRGRRGGRRPDPAADPGPGGQGVLDPRLGGPAQAVVHHRTHHRRRERLRHLRGRLTRPVSRAIGPAIGP